MPEEGTPAPVATPTEANPLQSELDTAKAENERLSLEWKQAQFVNQKQRNEMDQNRRSMETLRGQLTAEGYKEPEVSRESQMQSQLDNQADEMGLMRYKLENPKWKDHWDEMQHIFNDPTRAEAVAVFDRNAEGKAVPNMFKSLTNTQREVQYAKLLQAQEATEAAKAKNVTEQERKKGMATISGVSGSAGEETVDLDGMSSDDMIRAGLVDMDPRDPAKERHPKE